MKKYKNTIQRNLVVIYLFKNYQLQSYVVLILTRSIQTSKYNVNLSHTVLFRISLIILQMCYASTHTHVERENNWQVHLGIFKGRAIV